MGGAGGASRYGKMLAIQYPHPNPSHLTPSPFRRSCVKITGDASDERASHGVGAKAQLSPLRFREDGRQRSLPPLPEQAPVAHALGHREHPVERRMDRRPRAESGGELLRRALPIDPQLRRREEAVGAKAHRRTGAERLSWSP